MECRAQERRARARTARPRFGGAFFFDMNADIERLIALQRLDSTAQDAQRRLADEPERQKEFDARLDAAREKATEARQSLTENQNARRTVEKEVAVHHGRLSKFRDQLMSVKTNVEYQAMQTALERIAKERAELVKTLNPGALAIFESVSRRRHGVAVAEARDGICTICHVRLRPQVFNTVRRNEDIVQCDSCQRILYFVPTTTPATSNSVSQ